MYSFIKFVLITALFCCAIETVRSQYDTDQFLLAHKDHNNHLNFDTLLFMSIAAKYCRVIFNPLNQQQWINVIEGCAEAYEYNNTEEVPPIYDTSDYSRYFNHSDNGFHSCVLYYMDYYNLETAPLYVSEDNQIVIDDMEINHHGFEPGVPYFTYGKPHVNFKRQNIAYEIMEKCDKAAGRAIAEVYGYIDPKFDKSELLDKTKPPFDEPQYAYASLFSFCLQNEYGNNLRYNYGDYYYYCFDKLVHRYAFFALCKKYLIEKPEDEAYCYPELDNLFIVGEKLAKYKK